MSDNRFVENVKPGGLTTATEIRILICYLLGSVPAPITREQMEEALVGEELANYFVLADSLAHLVQQGLVAQTQDTYTVTEAGRTVGNTLAIEVPRTVREAAARAVIRAQRLAALEAAHKSEIIKKEDGYAVHCVVGDEAGPLLNMEIFLPDKNSAEAAKHCFIENGDSLYKLVLAALTRDEALATQELENMKRSQP